METPPFSRPFYINRAGSMNTFDPSATMNSLPTELLYIIYSFINCSKCKEHFREACNLEYSYADWETMFDPVCGVCLNDFLSSSFGKLLEPQQKKIRNTVTRLEYIDY